ncbi:hypothetical protein [Halomonas salipaludis]|nr:hypothetical protein [Halomonas salipaludis]
MTLETSATKGAPSRRMIVAFAALALILISSSASTTLRGAPTQGVTS